MKEYKMGELVECAGGKYGIIIGKVGKETYHVYMSEYGAEVQRYSGVRLHEVEEGNAAMEEIKEKLIAGYKALQNRELSGK